MTIATAPLDSTRADSGTPGPGFESRIFGHPPDAAVESLSVRFAPDFALARQRSLSYLVKLHRAISEDHKDLAETLLQRFCQALTDYLSAGHQQSFDLERPRARDFVAMAGTSRDMLRFIDLFSRFGASPDGDLHVLLGHLDQVALTLITRIELEDELQLGMLAPPHLHG
ncbi:MAG: hypothetical protein AAGI15_03575 [Pseudomonadota bacterium]